MSYVFIQLLFEVAFIHLKFFCSSQPSLEEGESVWFWSYNPWRPSENMLGLLALKCDGSHTHKYWKPTIIDGVVSFPTRKEEAAYPITLCERLASILYRARVRNLEGPKDLVEQTKADTDAGKRQLFTGQPRTKTILQPVSEFGYHDHLTASNAVWLQHLLS